MTSLPRFTHSLCLLLACALAQTAAAESDDEKRAQGKIVSPEQIEGVTNVDAEGLIEMVMQHPDLVLVDSRIISDRNEGYIEGSVSLPDIDTNCDTLDNVLAAPGTPVLFYCNGIRCGRSANAAEIALSCGYNGIYWFRGGIEEWQKKEYPLVQ